MKSKFVVLSLLLVFNFSFISPIFSEDIKFQRVLNTESYNQAIAQDKDGILWITTEGKGLFVYDGNKLKNIKIGDGKNLLQIMTSIFVDRDGLIWFFSPKSGLCCYNKTTDSCKYYKSEKDNPNTLTSDNSSWQPHLITEDKEGIIWIGTADGLNSYDKKTGKFTQYKYNPDNPNSLSNNSVWAVFVDKKGLVWIGTSDGLNCYDKNIDKFYCYKHDPAKSETISSNQIRAIVEDKGGNLWIGTKNTGIDKFDKRTGKITNYRHDPRDKNSLSHNEIHQLMVDRYNNLWICNDGNVGQDLYNIKTSTFKHYSYDPDNINSISSNIGLSSFEDCSGTVWLIDSSGGLNKCIQQKNIFKNYIYNPKNESSISSNNIAKVYEDKKGNIWIGTYKGGMCLYTKDDTFENFNHNPSPLSLPGTSVHSILDALDNKLWLGVKQGFISLFNIDTKRIIKSFKNPYLEITPAFLTQDNTNPDILWFACSYEGGLFKFNTTTGEFTAFKHDPSNKYSVSSEMTFGILQDGNLLWIATGRDGLCKFDKTTKKCTYYKHDQNDKNSISGNMVVESFIDSKGGFWVTTEDGGLNKFNKQTGKFTHYGVERGFPSKSTMHILEDNDGYLWISTDSGIVKFDPKKLKVINWFTTADGLPGNQFHKIACPLKDSIGNFWFPGFGSFGLCKFNPEEANKTQSNYHIPSIVLSSFKSKEGTCNEDGIKKITAINLPWPDNSFEFTFVALDYANPEKNQYAYKLEGFDKNWNYVGTKNFGQYSNLNPGEYTLRLKGSNNDGIWNEEGIAIKITITPPFWMTSWFKAIVGISILSIIGGIILLIVRSLKKKAIHMRDHAVAEVAGQVAHDIRSPLAALRTALKQVKELSEHDRILLRTATNRISDIIHNLTVKYDMDRKAGVEKHLKVELISSLLEHLMAEKRFQMLEKSIEIVLELGDNAHSCFANLEPGKFKRVISNLINNSADAIESKGVIRVVLEKQSDTLMIKIIDNGKGIPEDVLLKIKQEVVVSTKKEGHGIGVFSAVENIKSWNGTYDIQSKVGEGTTFTIALPIAEEPDWFQWAITIPPNTDIIVLDDDKSIHLIWESRFHEYLEKKTVTLKDFYEPRAFSEYCKTSRSERDLFLVDYELLNSNETGLDLIEQLDLKQHAILVTSRYEEPEIRERISKLGIKIIPKNFAPYIPLSIVNETVKEEQPELIFIDDDKSLTEAWEMCAASTNKKLATFNRSEDFKKVMNRYNKTIPIYIDSNLKEKIPGEMFAKFLHEQGFQTIYLATGYEKSRFGHMPWIKDVVTKEPPF